MNSSTQIIGIVVLCFVSSFGFHADAHVPVFVDQTSLRDIEQVTDPELSQAFYGHMKGFPHTYEIRSDKPFTLFTKILLPDTENTKNNVSGIVINATKQSGRVQEVARLHAKDAAWDTEFEFFGGDTYRNGPEFETELEPGIYRIEVSTPNNVEQYVLAIGKKEEMNIGYFELVGRLMDVKEFFGKPKFFIIQSVFVYGPILIVSVLIWGGIYIRRKRSLQETV